MNDQYIASPFSRAVREVQGMFPNGNFEDYWLGTPAYDNTRLRDEPGWVSLESVLRKLSAVEAYSWRPADDATEALMRHDTESGGGLIGATPELTAVRAAMVVVGNRALEAERRLERYTRR